MAKDMKKLEARIQHNKQALAKIPGGEAEALIRKQDEVFHQLVETQDEAGRADTVLRVSKRDVAGLESRMKDIAFAANVFIHEFNCGRSEPLALLESKPDPVATVETFATRFDGDPELGGMAAVAGRRAVQARAARNRLTTAMESQTTVANKLVKVEGEVDKAITDAEVHVRVKSEKGSEARKLIKRTHRGTKKAKGKTSNVPAPAEAQVTPLASVQTKAS